MAESLARDPIEGVLDDEFRLIKADPVLSELQASCGGKIPGTLAVPELFELVSHCRLLGLKLVRPFAVSNGEVELAGIARVEPIEKGEGWRCRITIDHLHRKPSAAKPQQKLDRAIDAIDRVSAELVARLDADQRLLAVEWRAGDLDGLGKTMRAAPLSRWYDHFDIPLFGEGNTVHWRLADGIEVEIKGSQRRWRLRLIASGRGEGSKSGFDLLLVADRAAAASETQAPAERRDEGLAFETIRAGLRGPVARIIANAETIRARLAGPLREEYVGYAQDIRAAGQHLSELLDDFADLEVIESPQFTTARERVDLVDVAKRAIGILALRARQKAIELKIVPPQEPVAAIGEFRRVLQIALNLIGNAINYSPEGSLVELSFEADQDMVTLLVRDEGPGVPPENREKLFEKFERLGRHGDGGSGLGLYISRRLARAMGGELRLLENSGEGACFALSLPAAR